MKVSSSITSSSVRTVGSFKKVSNIPARVQSRWVLSLLVSRFSSFCNRFSLCLAAVSLRSAIHCLCLSFSNSSLMGNFSFLIIGKTKATNFLRLIAFCLLTLFSNHHMRHRIVFCLSSSIEYFIKSNFSLLFL